MIATSTLLALISGALVGAGVLVLVLFFRGVEPSASPGSRHSLSAIVEKLGKHTLIGIGVGLLVLVVTRWPVAAGAAGVLAASWTAMFGGASGERQAIAKIEGLAAWTESLRDTIAGAVGLEQAIPATSYAAHPAIAPAVRTMVDRMRVRTPLPVALEGFAQDLDDPTADLVCASLILNSRLRGPGLRDVLTSLADSAREELDMRRRVNAGRRSTRRSVQIVVGVTLAFVGGLVLFNRSYLEPYDSPVGQLVLLVVIAIFAVAFAWLRRLSRFEVPGRFLTVRAPAATAGAAT
jgi:Flp pilus assembly protein TadB